jgi:FkbM family methyltransferase
VNPHDVAAAWRWHEWRLPGCPERVQRAVRMLALRRYRGIRELTLADGVVMHVRLDEYLQCAIAKDGDWEGRIFDHALRDVPAHGVALDVGAHVGYATLRMAAHCAAGRVVAFEPLPSHADQVAMSATRNGWSDRVTVVRAAASDTDGEMTFDAGWGPNQGMGHLVPASGGGQRVRTVALDSWLDAHGIGQVDFCKVDVEGAEGRVLAGMSAGLAAGRYRRVLLELHPDALPGFGTTEDAVLATLRGAGFRLRWWHDAEGFTDLRDGTYVLADYP